MRVLVASCLLLTACIGETHECKNDLPGVFVHSNDAASGDHPEYVDTNTWDLQLATAVNGVQRFAADNEACDDTTPLMINFVRSNDPQFAVTFTSSTFDFKPVTAGAADIEINGVGASTSESLKAASIDHAVLVAPELGEPGAFYAGAPFAVIELLDASGAPLVDRNLSVASDSFQLGDKWNHLALGNAPAGQYSLAVNAGGRAWPVAVTLVDHLSGVMAAKSNVDGLGDVPVEVCFFAYLGPVLVAGVPWKFSFDTHDAEVSPDRANCVTVTDAAGATRTVTAEALGFSTSATATFH